LLKKAYIPLIILAFCSVSYAQKKCSLSIKVRDSAFKGFKMPDYDKKFSTLLQCKHEVQRVLFALYDQAFLTATVDSMVQDTTHMTAYITHGSLYQLAYLNKGNVDEGVLSQTGYRQKVFFHKPFYYKSVRKIMDKILMLYENHGYPFAQIKLDSVKLDGNNISAALAIHKNKVEKIDSVVVKGDLKLAPQYLYGYLGIKPGDMYDESKMRVVSTRLKALPFLYETKPMQIIFVEDKVKVLLYLGKKSANQFNGIVGILPNTITGKITITGDVSLQLMNSFHHAEEIGFHWQHLQLQTENLTIHLSYPYLFSTPIGIDGDLKLFKQDTTYLQVDSKIGLKYLLIGGNYFKVFYENISSSLLSTSLLQYQTTDLPPYADVTTDLYGIEYKANGLDYIYNPQRGYEILVSAAAGTKTINVNSRLNPAIYNGLQLKSDEYRFSLNGAYYIPLFNRTAFKIGLQGAYINAPSLMLNDLYRIGGFSVLRGFDEQSIYASAYGVGTAEIHYLLEQNSYFFLFFDQGWYQEQTDLVSVQDMPFGFGGGMTFQTKAGIFSISYALGKEFSNPISFKNGKINFGIASYF
jgi:outer membrane protein assembly factor BamA